MPSSPMYNDMHTPAALTVSVDSLRGRCACRQHYRYIAEERGLHPGLVAFEQVMSDYGGPTRAIRRNSRQDALALLLESAAAAPPGGMPLRLRGLKIIRWNSNVLLALDRSSSTYTTGNAPWPPQMYRPRHKSRPSPPPRCPSPPSSYAIAEQQDRRQLGEQDQLAAARGSATFKSADSPAWTACWRLFDGCTLSRLRVRRLC